MNTVNVELTKNATPNTPTHMTKTSPARPTRRQWRRKGARGVGRPGWHTLADTPLLENYIRIHKIFEIYTHVKTGVKLR